MYDVIILDLNMPISDGFDACKKIRQLYESVKFFQKANNQSEHSSSTQQLLKELKPLIIACSSDDMESPLMKRRLDEAGFDYAISSPLTAKYVKDILTVQINSNIENLDSLFNIHKIQQIQSRAQQDSVMSKRFQLP